MLRYVAGLTALLCALLAGGFFPGTVRAGDDPPERVTIRIDELDGSGVRGTAVLTARGDTTLVAMDVTGAPGTHPDHIHRSTCDDPEPDPLYPLTDVVLSAADPAGHSETVVDVSLADLLAEPHLILIHKSADEIDVYLACADITADAVVDMADTGAGPASGWPRAQGLGLAVLAAALAAVAALGVRRRTLGTVVTMDRSGGDRE
jgi:hypothetical protein